MSGDYGWFSANSTLLKDRAFDVKAEVMLNATAFPTLVQSSMEFE